MFIVVAQRKSDSLCDRGMVKREYYTRFLLVGIQNFVQNY